MQLLAWTLIAFEAIAIIVSIAYIGKPIERTTGGAILSTIINGGFIAWIAVVML